MAYVIRQGTIFPDETDIPITWTVQGPEHRVPLHPIGVSLLLVPFTYLGWQSVFLLNLGFHLLGAYFFLKLLRHFGLSDWLVVLYLFYPPFVLYSRTLMSDIPSTAIFVVALYFYLNPTSSKAAAGALLGANLLVRPTNLLLALPLLLIQALKGLRQSPRQWLSGPAGQLLFGFSPFLLLFGLMNYYTLGSPFRTVRSFELTGMEHFSLAFFPRSFAFYLVSLLLIYPLMLLSSLFARRTRKVEFGLAILLVIGFHSLSIGYSSFEFYRPQAKSFLDYAIVGLRYLLPILPLFLLNYAEILERGLSRLGEMGRSRLIPVGVALLLASTWIIHALHQGFLEKQIELKEAVYAHTEDGTTLVYDQQAAELVQKAWGRRQYVPYYPEIDLSGIHQKAEGGVVYLLYGNSVLLAKLADGKSDLVVHPVLRRAWLHIDRVNRVTREAT
jgi:hypothetical protein